MRIIKRLSKGISDWRAELLRRRSGRQIAALADEPPTPASQELRPPCDSEISFENCSSSVRQELHEPLVHEKDFLSRFRLRDETGFREVVEIARGRDAVAETSFFEVPDFAIWPHEKLFDQLF